MQIEGYFNTSDEPVIGIDVASSRIEVLVDTGFNGSLILPTQMAQDLDLNFERGVEEFYSVTGEILFATPCSMEIDWFGRRLRVPVATCSEVYEAILGGRMLSGCSLTIDYRRRTVSIVQSF